MENPVSDRTALFKALEEAACAWQDPDYGPRKTAEERTLSAPNRFTEEALVFAINQQMNLITRESLESWIPNPAPQPCAVVVLNAGNIPFVGLQDFLAVLATGHSYRGILSSRSPHLLPAFAGEVSRCLGQPLEVQFGALPELLQGVAAMTSKK